MTTGGVTLRDGAALVGGAAVASALMRSAFPWGAAGVGWAFLGWTLGGVALTSAGPFLYLARRFGRRPPGYPRPGDRLWALLGLPWVSAAPIRTAEDALGWGAVASPGLLSAGVALATLVAAWHARSLMIDEPGESRGPTPWTDRVGVALAVAFPLQWGLVLTVLGGDA